MSLKHYVVLFLSLAFGAIRSVELSIQTPSSYLIMAYSSSSDN